MPRHQTLIRLGDDGEAVRDVQQRLHALGYLLGPTDGCFGPDTEAAVRQFQDSRGLAVDGICGPHTWTRLVEAGRQLGDRLLYLCSPMQRGDDVEELQRQLCSLGFDARKVDGIFGPDTEHATREFQRNLALTVDGVCGRDTLRALERLGNRTGGRGAVSVVREYEELRQSRKLLHNARIVVAQEGGLDAFVRTVAAQLRARGATVVVFDQPDPSVVARAANSFDADALICFTAAPDHRGPTGYFAVEGYESVSGHQLAALLELRVAEALGAEPAGVRGMQLPVLRETRMPAIWCQVGTIPVLIRNSEAVAAAVVHALAEWIEPLRDSNL